MGVHLATGKSNNGRIMTSSNSFELSRSTYRQPPDQKPPVFGPFGFPVGSLTLK
jgi:hypothetical protein